MLFFDCLLSWKFACEALCNSLRTNAHNKKENAGNVAHWRSSCLVCDALDLIPPPLLPKQEKIKQKTKISTRKYQEYSLFPFNPYLCFYLSIYWCGGDRSHLSVPSWWCSWWQWWTIRCQGSNPGLQHAQYFNPLRYHTGPCVLKIEQERRDRAIV